MSKENREHLLTYHQEGVEAAWLGLPKEACTITYERFKNAWMEGWYLAKATIQRSEDGQQEYPKVSVEDYLE